MSAEVRTNLQRAVIRYADYPLEQMQWTRCCRYGHSAVLLGWLIHQWDMLETGTAYHGYCAIPLEAPPNLGGSHQHVTCAAFPHDEITTRCFFASSWLDLMATLSEIEPMGVYLDRTGAHIDVR